MTRFLRRLPSSNRPSRLRRLRCAIPSCSPRCTAGWPSVLGIAPDPRAPQNSAPRSRNWPAFADSAAALAYLKQHYRLVILSNVDRAVVRAKQPEARRHLRCDLHRRGHRLLQAGPAQLRLSPGPPGGAGDRARSRSCTRPNSPPRPHPGQADRARHLLDPPARRQGGPWRDARAGHGRPARFSLREPRRDGRRAPRRVKAGGTTDAHRHANWSADGSARDLSVITLQISAHIPAMCLVRAP